MKTCYRCRVAQPVTQFYSHPSATDGLSGKCKMCCREYSRARQRLLLSQRAPRLCAHCKLSPIRSYRSRYCSECRPLVTAESMRRYRNANQEALNRLSKAYCAKHKPWLKARRQYPERERDKQRAYYEHHYRYNTSWQARNAERAWLAWLRRKFPNGDVPISVLHLAAEARRLRQSIEPCPTGSAAEDHW